MKYLFKNIILAVCAFGIAMSVPGGVLAGLGISPSQMIVPNLTKGSHTEKIFVLSRSDPTDDLYFKVSTEGATKDWITLDKGFEFKMPKGEQRFTITVIVDIPKNAANGEYQGGIRLASTAKLPGKFGGSGASVALSALIQTDFTVSGQQISEFEISSIGIQNSEAGFPLDVFLTLINTGNVVARPTKVHIEVFDISNTKSIEIHDVTEMESVEPLMSGKIAIPVPTKLGIGQYWARITVFKNQDAIKEQNLVFEIVEAGSLQKTGNLKELISNKTANIGDTVKITGVFENTGPTNYPTKLVAEIYKDDRLVKMTESELATVNTGETANLSAYFIPGESGLYTIKAHAVYSGRKSPEKEISILIESGKVLGLATTRNISVPILGVILASVLIGVGIFFKIKRSA